MSRFSGKCDFYDEIMIIGGFDIFRNKGYKVYVGGAKEPIVYNEEKDLIPYYPHIITCQFTLLDTGSTIYLSEKSWVDIEEERYGHMGMRDIYREELRKEIAKYC